MPTEIKVPAAGESITSANVARWHKQDGDRVAKGETLVTLETDKVSNELSAEVGGVLHIQVEEGEEVGIGTVIGSIDESAEAEESGAGEDTGGESNGGDSSTSGARSGGEDAAGGEPIEVKVPAAGESISTANVAQWHKKDGESTGRGEVLATLETDKVSTELEAEAAGRLEILVAEGEEVDIGTVIARIHPGEGGKPAPAKGGGEAGESKKPERAPSKPPGQPSPAKPAEEPAASTAAADKPDFTVISGSPEPPAASAAPAADGRTSRRKMSMLRRKIASHLVNAQQTAAILTTFNEADMSAVMKLRKQVQEEFVAKHEVKLGFMSFFVKAVVQALKDVPQVNGSIEGNEIVENHFYDVGVAIGTEKGLVVPVIRDADRKSFAEIEHDIIGYANKAREGTIQIEELQGGVFTISNGGTYGSLLSTPILNPPQSGILGMHTIQQRPVAIDGKVEVRPMMYLALSYDHRLVDGKEAVTFLIRIKECIENPTRLMLEM